MSNSYYGLPKHDTTIIGPTVEGTLPDAATIDVAALHSAIERCGLAGAAKTLRWEGDGSYVCATVLPTHVEIQQGTGGGDEQIDVLLDILDALKNHGLHVWDPQNGSWFFE
jgi:hypothetical protein